jgi:hypothetical protein
VSAQVDPGDPHTIWSAGEDGTVRQVDSTQFSLSLMVSCSSRFPHTHACTLLPTHSHYSRCAAHSVSHSLTNTTFSHYSFTLSRSHHSKPTTLQSLTYTSTPPHTHTHTHTYTHIHIHIHTYTPMHTWQIDVRTRDAGEREAGGRWLRRVEANVLIRAHGVGKEFKSVCVNASAPALIAVASDDCFVRVYDRRRLSVGHSASASSSASACLHRFSPPHLCSSDSASSSSSIYPTSVRFSPLGDSLLVNYSGDQIYSFSTHADGWSSAVSVCLCGQRACHL